MAQTLFVHPASEKLTRLLEEYIPSTLVVKEIRPCADSRTAAKLKEILDAIKTEARRHRVAIRSITRKSIRTAFSDLSRTTKYEIASALSKRFPELGWKLPPKRKPWQSEDYRMSIFDAAAAGVAYFAQRQSRNSAAPPT